MRCNKEKAKRCFICFATGMLGVFIGIIYFITPQCSRISTPDINFNVLLISIDAARTDRFSFEGNSQGLTPNIDRLINEGIVFKRAYCISGSTPPSMGGLFTSKLPY